ncbi:MAG TPA: TAXI family TRAP transporter solute-binding subunit [Reyranella sp.]|nr:TAXI family TRAP transporter solute-binding subunit [Reyranella sp.]
MMRRRTLLYGLPAAILAPAAGRAQTVSFSLGTSIEGGGFQPYSAALVDALKGVDPLLEIKMQRTKGSTENAQLLQIGDIDMGLVSGEVWHEWQRVNPTAPRLTVISVMYSTPGMLCARADSRYRTISDLKGRPVVWSPRGTGSAVQARYVMDGIGLDIDRDFQSIYPENFVDGPFMVLESRAAAIWGSGLRWPGFIEIASRPLGARFIAPNADEIARIRAKYPFLAILTVPGGLYPGQFDPITTVGAWSYILARPGLDDAVAHRMASSLYKADRIGALSKLVAQTTARETLTAVKSVDELHPAVLAFYREKRLMK